MTTDPRVDAVSLSPDITEPVRRHLTGGDVKRFLAAADAVDPLRRSLREPSDELIEQLVDTYYEIYNQENAAPGSEPFWKASEKIGMRAVLAALADEFGVKDGSK